MIDPEGVQAAPLAASMKKRFRLSLRPLFSILGLLLLGAGVCSSVFCAVDFHDADEARESIDFARSVAVGLQEKGPQWYRVHEGINLDAAGWQGLAHQYEREAQSKFIRAYQLLALSIGLILGGACLWLLGCGLRLRTP